MAKRNGVLEYPAAQVEVTDTVSETEALRLKIESLEEEIGPLREMADLLKLIEQQDGRIVFCDYLRKRVCRIKVDVNLEKIEPTFLEAARATKEAVDRRKGRARTL